MRSTSILVLVLSCGRSKRYSFACIVSLNCFGEKGCWGGELHTAYRDSLSHPELGQTIYPTLCGALRSQTKASSRTGPRGRAVVGSLQSFKQNSHEQLGPGSTEALGGPVDPGYRLGGWGPRGPGTAGPRTPRRMNPWVPWAPGTTGHEQEQDPAKASYSKPKQAKAKAKARARTSRFRVLQLLACRCC